MRKYLVLLLIMLSGQVFAADITGLWRTVDDETGQSKSIVKITENQGIYQAVVAKLLLKPADTVCEKCKDERKGQKIVGMKIVQNVTKNGDEYGGGKILDPANGKEYRAKLWREGDNLKVRGYLGPFFRTQTWYPATNAD